MTRSAGPKALLLTLLTVLASVPNEARTNTLPSHPLVVYHDSWAEIPATLAADTSLAGLPAYISVVDLAFARPDLTYNGGLDLSETGLEYRYSGSVLRDAISLLKFRHPATKVLLSVGGSAYTNWGKLDPYAIARLVADIGADGVDVDFETKFPGCAYSDEKLVHCRTGPVLERSIEALRHVFPRPLLLTASVWSVGAYGEGNFRDARPFSHYTGMMLDLLRSPMGSMLDMLCINAYDAGTEFQPLEAFAAYRAAWPGTLALGLAVQRRGGPGPYYSEDEAEALASQVVLDPRGGMMLYPLLAMPEGPGSSNRPDGRALSRAICLGMGAIGCDATIP